MTFKLVQQKSTKANAVFHIVDARGTTCGSVNVPPEEAADLQKHWRGAHAPGTPAGTAAAARTGVKLKPLPRLSRAAILRGC
jgi:hypothetical protein